MAKIIKKKGTKVPESTKTLAEVKDILKPGMTVRIYQKIKELNPKGEEKERLQYFEGLIIAHKHGKESGGDFTNGCHWRKSLRRSLNGHRR
jgi:ribosomal protein L19